MALQEGVVCVKRMVEKTWQCPQTRELIKGMPKEPYQSPLWLVRSVPSLHRHLHLICHISSYHPMLREFRITWLSHMFVFDL